MKNIKKTVPFIIWIFLWASLGFYLIKIPQVRDFIYQNLGVREVLIEGSNKLDKKEVEDILANKIWFSINEKELNREFKEKFPFIKSLKLEKPSFRKVKLIINEYKPFAFISINREKFFITKDGIKLDKEYYPEVNPKDLIKIVVNDKEINKKKLKKLEILHNEFCKKFKPEKYIIYKSQIACVLKNKKTFLFSFENLKSSIKRADKFLQKVKDIEKYRVIDFRYKHMVIGKEKKKNGKK